MTRRRWYCVFQTHQRSIWRGVADGQPDIANVERDGRTWRVYVWGTPSFARGALCGTLKRGKAMAEGREEMP